MAVTNLKSLVLNGVSVKRDVAGSMKGIGFNPATLGTEAKLLSLIQHPTHTYPQTDADPVVRPQTRQQGVVEAALRAGRSAECRGKLACRTLAPTAWRPLALKRAGGMPSAALWGKIARD